MSARKKTDSVKTVKEFVRWAQGLPGRSLLYRGLADVKWDVESAAHRRVNKSKKAPVSHEAFKNYIVQLLYDARMSGHQWHEGKKLSDLELLARLQHFGAATCLIDFTYNPLVALWFACRQLHGQCGKVVVMNTSRAGTFAMHPSESAKSQRLFRIVGEQELQKNIAELLDDKTLWTWKPLPRENRVVAQQSTFVLAKTKIEYREYEKVCVPSSAKVGIRSTLRDKFGVTEESMFDDFAGFALANAHNRPYEDIAEKYYLHAEDLFQNDRFKKALQYCDQAIDANSQHVEAHHLRGECNTDLRNHQEAIGDFSRAIAIDPKHTFSILMRGFVYEVDLKEPSKAVTDYTRIIELALDSKNKVIPFDLVYAYYRRGCVKARREQHDSAIEDFDSAIALDSWRARLYLARAKSLRALRRVREALADEKKAAELDPKLRKSNPAQDPLL